MTAGKLKSYRFATEAQWSKCLFVQTDRESFRKGEGIRPFAPYARPAAIYESRGASAPVVTSTREILWRDHRCSLHRLVPCDDDQPEATIAPHAIACADRLVSTRSGLWVKGDRPDSLERYDEETLTRLLIARIRNAKIIDIARDGHDSLWALIERDGEFFAVHVSRNGRNGKTINFKGISEAQAFVFLKRESRFVVLTGGQYQKLNWFDGEGGRSSFGRTVSAMRQCFHANVLGSDSRDRVFLGGADDDGLGPAYVLIFDVDGNAIGDVALDPEDAPATGLAASRDQLLVTSRRGLLRFTTAEVVPEGAEHVQCTLTTPLLFSADREDRRRWLRVEATGMFPEGSTLEISWAATDDQPPLASAILKDDSTFISQTAAAKVLSEPYSQRGRTVFQGAAEAERKNKKQTYSVGLFDVTERYLRVCITLAAGPGARLPVLSELNVLYPGRTLMEDLPAIYQREESIPNSFLRKLVGVLETTTQGIDARIASMGSQIHPATARESWLDFIARWLGVPWDDGLTLKQKRAIVMRAPDLAKTRGTRAGLEVLLESLIPGKPPRFRVTDATADNGFAIVGGASCEGSRLPAMLGGYTRWRPELGSGAVLGSMRLPCPDQLDDGAWQLAGTVEVEVAATAEERAAWKPWLRALIEQMIPLTARLKFRWVTAWSLRSDRLDDTITLEDPPEPHLGTDAITGLARLPEQPLRLSACGEPIGTRLR